jgi:tetratricopeptide (TPR) repeat protein
MENDTLTATEKTATSDLSILSKNDSKLFIFKSLGILISASIAAGIGAFIVFYPTSKPFDSPIVLEENNAPKTVLINAQKVPIAEIQVKYQKAFRHLKRMDIYYREARDFLMDLNYEQAVRKCDSALLCKTEKPLNWTAQKWGDVYNIQAESLLYLGKIEEAERAAINALTMDKTDKLGYLHLIYAQILAAKDKKATPLFLSNFTFALKKKLPVWDYMELDGFDAVQKDPSVKRLLKAYKTE